MLAKNVKLLSVSEGDLTGGDSIIPNIYDGDRYSTVYAVFEPNQIKSIRNNGKFDKNKEKKGYSQAFFKHKLDRIHIGIACEHFLKALFLNKGYAIYEYELKIPLEIDNPEKGIKRKNKTISFDFMIQHIPKIISLTGENLNKFKEGLSIIKDWRNKVKKSHAFIILVITLIGIPLGFILLVVYLVSLYFARIYVSYWVGITFFGKILGKRHYLPYILGLFIVFLVGFIPYLGGFLNFVILIWGLGASFLGLNEFYNSIQKNRLI